MPGLPSFCVASSGPNEGPNLNVPPSVAESNLTLLAGLSMVLVL